VAPALAIAWASSPWAAVILIALCAGGAVSDTIRHSYGPIRFAFDSASGAWTALGWANCANLLSPDRARPEVEIATQDGPSFPTPGRRLVESSASLAGGRWRCQVETADGPWRAVCFYEVEPGAFVIRRSVCLRWLGERPVKITAVTLRVPSISIGGEGDNFYLLPADFPIQRRVFRNLQPGRRATEQGIWANTGEALVYSPKNKVCLLAGFELDVDGAQVAVEEDDGAVSIAHQFSTLARLAPGESLDCGQQCLIVASGSWDDALRGLRRLSDSLNNGPPRERPQWLHHGAIYSCYPGGSMDTGFGGAGGFSHFEQRLPYLADLGFTALWLNPIHTPAPWIYGIADYRAVAPELGTKDDLKRFVTRAHSLGLKVLLDLVPHGPNEDTPAAREAPPQAWTYDESGNLEHAWGGLAGDYASPAWKAYMADIAAYWVREFGVDGYRVDCAPGNGPNWKRGDGRRPSASSPLGGLELLQSVRETIRPINPDAALFPESWAPIFFRFGDLVYDYPFYQVMRRLVAYPSTEEWIRDTRAWLQMERLTYPQAALGGLVRFTENHDTVRSDEYFGMGPAQALTALCIFAQGTPMVYQDQEIGFGASLKQWLNLRQQHAELYRGDADYEAIRCSSPGILAFVRQGESGAAVVAISFMPGEEKARLEWPPALGARFPFAHLADSNELLARRRCAASVTVPAYQPVVILLRPEEMASRRQPQARPYAAGPLLLEAKAAPAGADVTEYRLRLARAQWWFVNTCEGLLLDRFADRHTVEPITRYERLWRPLEAGLWDGSGAPAMGIIAAGGRGLVVSDFRFDSLLSARLEEPSNRGEAVAIIARGRGLVLRSEAPLRRVASWATKPAEQGASLLRRVAKERPFTVREVADAWAALRSLGVKRKHGNLVSVDPLRVTLDNQHYRVILSRRRGGLISNVQLRKGGKSTDVPVLGSDLYTDWGFYERGVRVSADVETTPRLGFSPHGGGVEVTFRGLLRTPSWNGVQRGYPAQPLTQYRITYRADSSPVLRVTFGLTPAEDHSKVEAFFAYLLSFDGVTGWFAETERGHVTGRPGQHPGTRLFETRLTKLAAQRPQIGFQVHGREATIRPIACPAKEADGLPQNVFFLDQGDNRLALFVAMLDGGAITLPAGVERTVSLDLILGE